jgi:hypothetical protein
MKTLTAPNVYANSPFFSIPSNPVQNAVLDADIENGPFRLSAGREISSNPRPDSPGATASIRKTD